MELLDTILKLDHIVNTKKDLDKVELNNSITLMRGTILEYKNTQK